MPTSDSSADPRHRLGAAKELLRQIADPHSALRLNEMVHPGAVNERIVEFLAGDDQHSAADGATPTVYPDATRVPIRRLLASRIPWPALAVCDLWPGDGVDHPVHGVGVVQGFDNQEWPDVVELVAAGRVLVEFDAGCVWVAAGELTRTSEANPVY